MTIDSNIVKWILTVTLRVGFWSSIVFTFLPLLTLIVSGILISLDGTVIQDLFHIIQLWLPFNFNVILLWSLTLVFAFVAYWLSTMIYSLLNQLIRD